MADQGTGGAAAGEASVDSGAGATASGAVDSARTGKGQAASAPVDSGTGGSSADADALRKENEQLRKDLKTATQKRESVKGDLETRMAALEGELATERSRAQKLEQERKATKTIEGLVAEHPAEHRELVKHVLRSYAMDGLDFAAEDPSPAKKAAVDRLKKEFPQLTVEAPKERGRAPHIPGANNSTAPRTGGVTNAEGTKIF